jgi:transmembrane sensor
MSKEHPDHTSPGSEDEQTRLFNYLIQQFLEGKASRTEQQKLHWMIENGFEQQFKEWIDRSLTDDKENKSLPLNARQEILGNILGTEQTQIIPVKRFRWRSWVAAAIVITSASLWFSTRDRDVVNETLSATGPAENPTESVRLSGKQFFYLPDGSSVLMNEGSELTYSPEAFDNGTREVVLKGEAYFDIRHNPKSFFRVLTGAVVTKVLGTAFNVNMNADEVIVTVARGLVEVSGRKGVYKQLKPDEQITVNAQTEDFKTEQVSAESQIDWKNAYLIFDNVTLNEVTSLIKTHYGVNLTFDNPDVLRCHVTASFLNEENIETVLTILSEMLGGSFNINGKTAVITGGACH